MSSAPIADYALLSDCCSGALVSAAGSVDWLCFPRFDSPSVFGRILGPDAGFWSIRPAGAHSSTRRYRGPTLVLETTHTTGEGCVTVTDALALGDGRRGHELGADSPGSLLRQVSCTQGSVDVDIVLCASTRLWPHPTPAQPGRRRHPCPRGRCGFVDLGPGGLPAQHRPRHRHCAGTPHPPRRRRCRLCPPLFALHNQGPRERDPGVLEPGRHRTQARGHRGGLDQLVRDAPELRRPVAGARGRQRADSAGADLLPERRHRGRPDHVAAGGGRRNAQLGLPLQLDPRRQHDPAGAVGRGLSGRGRDVLPVPGDSGRRPAGQR